MAIDKTVLRVMNKLFDAGYVTEKEMTSLTIKDLTEIKGLTVPEIVEVAKLQDAVKANRVISYISGMEGLNQAKEQL